jgi:arylsulfatase A
MLHDAHVSICISHRYLLTFCFWLTAATPCVSGSSAHGQSTTAQPTDTSQAESKSAASSVEQTTQVHRLRTTKRSPFDAFVYLNRIPVKAALAETPQDFAGRIAGRLANQEGRVLLKTPSGMKKNAYMGLKTFLRSTGDKSVGNCVACHCPPEFTDHHTRVGLNGIPQKTPSLRNLKRTKTELRLILQEKTRQATNIDRNSGPYASIRLNKRDITQVIAFLDTLHDRSDAEFRMLILNAELLDTSRQFE